MVRIWNFNLAHIAAEILTKFTWVGEVFMSAYLIGLACSANQMSSSFKFSLGQDRE
jgi:hypothetical protein